MAQLDRIHKFQDNATTQGNGNTLDVILQTSIKFQIVGNTTGQTLKFEASIDGTNFAPYDCAKCSPVELGSTTTGNNEIWEVSCTGLRKFRVVLQGNSTSGITVIANVKTYSSAIIKDITLPNYPSLVDQLNVLKSGKVFKGVH